MFLVLVLRSPWTERVKQSRNVLTQDILEHIFIYSSLYDIYFQPLIFIFALRAANMFLFSLKNPNITKGI